MNQATTLTTATRPAVLRRDLFQRLVPWMLLAPGLVLMLAIFAYPIVALLIRSLFDPGFTLEHYRHFFTTPVYVKVLWNTLSIGFQVTAICLLLGYPVAAFISGMPARRRALFMVFVLLPFWTSILVRTYAWMVLLQQEGLVNKIGVALGILDSPVQLVNNRFGLMVGMVQILLPYTIIPLTSVMQGIDRRLLRASSSLGAPPLQTFSRVFLPLSLPGVAAGCLLTFMLTLGFFITPALLGGRKDMMMAVLISNEVSTTLNWGFAATLSLVLLVVTMALLAVYSKFIGLDKMFGSVK